jgi:hypothetical protein
MLPPIKPLGGAALVALCTLPPMAWLWGFTVDDALISARVAHHLATGHGYRFNSAGPVVDAVTPLGWAPLLAPFAGREVWAGLLAAKWLGAAAWFVSAAWFGARLARLGNRALLVGASSLLTTVPLAAWAVAGMETGLVTALATFALGRGAWARGALALAAALRPELLPWALTLSAGGALLTPGTAAERVRRTLGVLGFVLAPFIAVAATRVFVFGEAYPLSLLAKPSDASSGFRYALGALALSGPVWLVVAGFAWREISAHARLIALAALVHCAALVVAGGDWMPFYRLFVPVLPGLVWVGAELAQRSSRLATGLRLTFAFGVSLLLAVMLGPSARQVDVQRRALIDGAEPLLRGAERVATLDVGWVGAATAATVVDLAGVTDPFVARLPGGHTSKRLPDGFLEARRVDALVLLAEAPAAATSLSELRLVRAVEARVPGLASAERFRTVGILPLRGTRQSYVVARRD